MMEIIAIILSVISIIISIITCYVSNKKSNAQVELEVKKMIDETKNRFIENYNGDKKIDYLIEEELNAYDKACSLYIDKKVDKTRFKKDYYYEINNLFDDKNFNEMGKLNKENCRYNCIKEVYNEWKVK